MTQTGSNTCAVQTSALTRTFGDFTAVGGIDLAVGQGTLFSLLGPNGAGKTTTIRMLCCLLRPTAGTATIMGRDVRTESRAVKQIIAVSPQETAIAEHLNARENLDLMAGLHGMDKREAKRRADELLDMMGLTERASDRAKKYSGGMKRRLSIAMALITDPQVLFLDEPTLGLDPQSRHAIWEHIGALKGEKTVVLTTHYLEEADALADEIAIIDEGKIIAWDTPEGLKKGISRSEATFIKASGLTDEAVAALRDLYPALTRTDGGVEVTAEQVDLWRIEDVLRPRGITVESVQRQQVTLDDVFLELTGKQMRE